jgi:ornithine cyclodeaminase
MAEAYRAVRRIERVMVWNIRAAGAERLARRLAGEAVTDLAAAVRQADIVSCATLSHEPLVRGEWLRPGTHLDLIGGFTPAMREADDEAVRRSRVFVDTDAALAEAGDLIDPIAHGVLHRENIAGTLFSLCRGETPGRRSAQEITLFKSVGSALEDLAAAGLAYE